jgi:hypothetical protein
MGQCLAKQKIPINPLNHQLRIPRITQIASNPPKRHLQRTHRKIIIDAINDSKP